MASLDGLNGVVFPSLIAEVSVLIPGKWTSLLLTGMVYGVCFQAQSYRAPLPDLQRVFLISVELTKKSEQIVLKPL